MSKDIIKDTDINRSNAGLLLCFRYLIIPKEIFLLGLSGNEAIVLAFVHSWLSENSNKFYFSNDKLAKVFNLTEQSISSILNRLKKRGLVDLSYKRKSDGGLIRFVNISSNKLNFKSQLKESLSSNLKKVIGTNNNISNNNINIKSITYLRDIPDKDLKEFTTKFNITERQVKEKSEELEDYCKAKGKRYNNYKAFLRNAVRKEYGKRTANQFNADKYKDVPVSKERLKKMAKIKVGVGKVE